MKFTSGQATNKRAIGDEWQGAGYSAKANQNTPVEANAATSILWADKSRPSLLLQFQLLHEIQGLNTGPFSRDLKGFDLSVKATFTVAKNVAAPSPPGFV